MDADRNDSNSSDSLTSETSTTSDNSSSESQRSTSSSSRNTPSSSSSSSESQRSTSSRSRNSPSSTEASSSRERSSAQTSSSSSRSRTSRDTSSTIDSSSSSASSRDRSSATEETSSQPETSSSRRSSRQASSSPQDSSTRSSRSSMDSSSSEESPTSNSESSRSPTQDSTTADRDSSSDASPTSSRSGGAGRSTEDSSSDVNSPTSSNRDSSSSNDNDDSSSDASPTSSNDNRDSSSDASPTSSNNGGDSSSDASPTSSNNGGDSSSDASPTSSSDDSTGGAAASSSARSSDDNSSSSEDNSSSAASETSSAGAGGNTQSSSGSASSSANAGAGAAGASSSNSASSPNSASSTVGGGAAGATGASGSSSSGNGGPTSTSDGAGGSSSGRSGGAGNANGSSGASSGSASSNNSSVSNLLSTETSLYVYTTNGSPTTSVVLNTVTLHPKGQLSSDADNNSYWHDHGAVGGTFAAVGIVAVGLLAAAGWFLYRRHKAKRMDADVVAAASAAAATTRTPFDDDDEEMHQAAQSYPQTHMESAPYAFSNGSGGAAHSAYYDSPGFHAPDHYASTDLPRNYASLADDPYGSDAGTRENAMRYYPGAAASSSNVANRGAYSDIPSDSAYSYNQPLFDSVPGGPPADREYQEAYYSDNTHADGGLAGAAGAAAAHQDPFANETSSSNSDLAMAPNASQTSGHASSTNDYDGARSHADSHATHYTSAPESVLPYRQSHDSSQSSELRAAPPVRHALEAPYHAQPMDQANYYSDNVSPFDDAATHAVQASAYHPTDATPAYSAGPYAPAVSDAKMPSSAASTTNRSAPTSASVPETSMEHAQEPTQLVNFSQHSPEVHNELETPFAAGLDRHPSDVTTDRGDWDPPALSSAWFPNGTTTHSAPAAPPTTSTHTSQQPMHSTGGVYEEETASVEHTPARLVVRNPSPEDQE